MAHILIIDDEKSIRITLKEILTQAGYHVSVAESATECLKILPDLEMDVVVSDINLPDMDGIRLLQKIRDISTDIQVIMITGQPTVETATEALRAGAMDYLQKPVYASDMLKVVKQAVRLKELSDEKKRLELINLNYQQKLEEMVSRRTLELQESYKKLKQEIIQKERAQKELQLRVAALDSAANAIVITDYSGTIIWVNKSFSKLTGYLFKEAIGQNSRLLKSGKQDKEFYRDLWDTILSGNAWHGELINQRKNGTYYTEEMTITPVTNENGRISHFISIKDDVTERKQLEAQIRQTQKMESIGTLAGGIAHDFNNLLTVINGYSDLALQQLTPNHPVYDAIKAIRQAGSRAGDLTRQLLAFSRKQIFQPKIIELNQVISEMAKMLTRVIGEHIKLDLKLSTEKHTIKADPGQIEQIVMNLVVNARDAINENMKFPMGRVITIRTERSFLDEKILKGHPDGKPGWYVLLSVQDTGTGMEPETIKKIFEPFFTTKTLGKGTGLGLSTVYGIVKQNKGCLLVNSQPGNGTTFNIYWPVMETEAKIDEPVIPVQKNAKGAETILIVEDDNDLRHLLSNTLSALGYKVFKASNGYNALNRIDNRVINPPIHLLLTDLVMPDMGGMELADILSGKCSGLKILYTSGHTDKQMVINGELRANINFIQKPFTIAELTEKIRAVLDSSQPAE